MIEQDEHDNGTCIPRLANAMRLGAHRPTCVYVARGDRLCPSYRLAYARTIALIAAWIVSSLVPCLAQQFPLPINWAYDGYDAVNAATYSNDGRLLALAGSPNYLAPASVELFSEPGHTCYRGLPSKIAAVMSPSFSISVSFSSDDSLLAVGGQGPAGGEVEIWNVATGKLVQTLLIGSKAQVQSAIYSPTGNVLAVTAYGTIELWSGSPLKLTQTIPSPAHTSFTGAAFSPDGTKLAVGFFSGSGGVMIVSVPSGSVLQTLTTSDAVFYVAYSPDGSAFACAGQGISASWEVNLWRASDYASLGSFSPEGTSVSALCFSRDGLLLAVGGSIAAGTSYAPSAQLWDVATQTLGQNLSFGAVTQGAVEALAFSPSNTEFAVCGFDLQAAGFASIWSWSSDVAAPEASLDVSSNDTANSVAFAPNGADLAAGGVNAAGTAGTLALMDVATGAELKELQTLASPVGSVAYSPDGKYLAACGNNGVLELWDLETLQPEELDTQVSGQLVSVAFSPDSSTIAAGGLDGVLETWSVHARTLISRLNTPDISDVAYSPDGKWLVDAGYVPQTNSAIVEMRGVKGGSYYTISPGGAAVPAFAISRDSSELAVGTTTVIGPAGGATTLSIWDLTSRKKTVSRELASSDSGVSAVSFSPQGSAVLVGQWVDGPTSYGYLQVFSCKTLSLLAMSNNNGFSYYDNGFTGYDVNSISISRDGRLMSYGSQQYGLVVAPDPFAGVDVSSVSVSPVIGDSYPAAIGTVTLAAAAGPGGNIVTLSSNSPYALLAGLPASVTVPAGATSASFPVPTPFVSSATTPTIYAISGGSLRSTIVSIAPLQVTDLSISPSSVIGGQTATGIVKLNSAVAAPVTIQVSSNPNAKAPKTVTVQAGDSMAQFQIITDPESWQITYPITATLGGSSASANLTVNPPSMTAFSLSPTAVVGGSNSSVTATVTLNGGAPSEWATVEFTSSDQGAATVPQSITVPAGKTSAAITVKHFKVRSSTSVKITAKYGGSTLTATLTVNP